jgi:hypothetical protein
MLRCGSLRVIRRNADNPSLCGLQSMMVSAHLMLAKFAVTVSFGLVQRCLET